MVIVETALVGAAGYGAYKGGDAAIRKGKEAHREHKFGQKVRSQQKELTMKLKTRSERLSRITEMRYSSNNKSSSSYNFGYGNASAPSSSVSSNKKQDQDDGFNERFQSIRQKLDHKPATGKTKKGGVMGLFRSRKTK